MPAIDTIAEARNAGVWLPSDPRAFTTDDMLRLAEFCEQRVDALLEDQTGLQLQRAKAQRLDEVLWFWNAARALRNVLNAIEGQKTT